MKADPATPRFHPGSSALIKKYLSPELFADLAHVRTESGFSLLQAIRSGLENPDSSIGIYTGDRSSYQCFAKILLPIIKEYHGVDRHCRETAQPAAALVPLNDCGILSTRIRVARSIDGIPFPPNMLSRHRLKVETSAIRAMAHLPPDLAGSFFSFSALTPEQYGDLVDKKLAFPEGDRFQASAGINRDFPLGRGVFLSRDKKFRIWVNEEDHLRIMAQSPDGDIQAVFDRLLRGLEVLGKHLDFCKDNRLGHLTSCPTNIGTAMRAGVHIHLPKLEKHPDLLKQLVHCHHLQVRGTRGEKTAVDRAVFDISNARRLGVSPAQIVRDLHSGISAIIDQEKNL